MFLSYGVGEKTIIFKLYHMDSKQLFKVFCAQFPHNSGFEVINELSEGIVIFTPNQEAADAFIVARKMADKIRNWVLMVLLLVLFSFLFVVFALKLGKIFYTLEDVMLFCSGLIILPLAGGIAVTLIERRRRKLKKIYRHQVVLCRREPMFDRIVYEFI